RRTRRSASPCDLCRSEIVAATSCTPCRQIVYVIEGVQVGNASAGLGSIWQKRARLRSERGAMGAGPAGSVMNGVRCEATQWCGRLDAVQRNPGNPHAYAEGRGTRRIRSRQL